MTTLINKPYERLQLFSGGGSRFGYYLGSYAALVDHDLTPDIIVGTCGGSLSALLVQLAPDPKQLQQLACSHELYSTIKAIRHVSPDEANMRLKLRYSTHALKRWRLSRNVSKLQRHQRADTYAQLLDELQQLAMFRINNEEQWLDELLKLAPAQNDSSTDNKATPDIAIIASRLYQTSDSNISPNIGANIVSSDALQLQELLFAPQRLILPNEKPSELAKTLTSPAHSFANERIHQPVVTLTQWDFATAVRASMADMYYLPPTHIPTLGWCLGGVINLTPIELACQLAGTVFAETKLGYDLWLAAPAIQRVFGFDPNQRLAQVHRFSSTNRSPSMENLASSPHNKNADEGVSGSQVHWLPFADNAQQLAGQQVQKRFNIRQAMVELVHSDYDGFVQQMQAQWQYGYQRTADYIQQQDL